jgi:hypothetical protein
MPGNLPQLPHHYPSRKPEPFKILDISFLCAHPSLKTPMQGLVALDFFTMLTVTCKVLFVLLILAHARRRVVHFNVTECPTAQWAPSPL